MFKWNELLTIVGLSVISKGNNHTITNRPTKRHLDLLAETLLMVGANFEMNANVVTIHSETSPYQVWMHAINVTFSERTSWYELSSGHDRFWIDPYMIGFVHQLDRLRCNSNYSCSGHSKRKPMIAFHDIEIEKIKALLNYVSIKYEAVIKPDGFFEIYFRKEDEYLLPLYSIRLSKIDSYMFDFEDVKLFKQSDSKDVLLELLDIPGKSMFEGLVRRKIFSYLYDKVDDIWIDQKGNLLGYKRYGLEESTILLSAHMDIYDEIKISKRLVVNDSIIHREDSILGADDRAGAAMIIALLKVLNDSNFKGLVKFVFSVEEEIGRYGAKAVDTSFLSDIDYAIVLDRKGNSDIVTNGFGQRYCSLNFENQLNDFLKKSKYCDSFRTTSGGISDITVWADNNIDSFNLSVGFYNAHTEFEYLNIKDWINSQKFVLDLIDNFNPVNKKNFRVTECRNDIG